MPPTLRPGSADTDAVKTLQKALNKLLIPSPQLGIKGNFLDRTTQAVKDFQVMAGLYPDGVVGPKTWKAIEGRGFALPAPGTTAMQPPPVPLTGDQAKDAPWVALARAELTRTLKTPTGAEQEIANEELKGHAKNNPRILDYLATYGYLADIAVTKKVPKLDDKGKPVLDAKGKPKLVDQKVTYAEGAKKGETVMMGDVDETPWCACFVGWCLKESGYAIKGTSAGAASWLKFGVELKEPRFGCVAVVYAKPTKKLASTTTSGNHVAFYISGDALPGKGGKLVLLGGNQGNRVSEKEYTHWTVKGFRWPG